MYMYGGICEHSFYILNQIDIRFDGNVIVFAKYKDGRGGGHDIVLKINTKVVKLQCFLEKDFRLGKGMGGGGVNWFKCTIFPGVIHQNLGKGDLTLTGFFFNFP